MNVKSNNIKRRRPTTTVESSDTEKCKRTNSKTFFLLDHRVCQTFFLKTLAISNGPLLKAFEHKNKFTNFFDGDDKRGRHQPVNKLSDETVSNIILHLERYASKNGNNKCKKRIICDPEIRSLKQLYRLYQEDNETSPSYTSFKKIFNDNCFTMADHLMTRPPKKSNNKEPLQQQEEEVVEQEIQQEIEYIIEDPTQLNSHQIETVMPVVQQILPQTQKVMITQLQDNLDSSKIVSYPVYEIQLVNFQLANNSNFQ